jgi:hypothetical protein
MLTVEPYVQVEAAFGQIFPPQGSPRQRPYVLAKTQVRTQSFGRADLARGARIKLSKEVGQILCGVFCPTD